MAAIAFTIPILPGMADDCRHFFQEATGSRLHEHEESRRRLGISKELVWVNEGGLQGDMLIVYLEGDDPRQANQAFAASDHPYDRWFKQHLLAVTGIDFNQPVLELPALALAWPNP